VDDPGPESHLGFSSRRGAAIFDGAVGTSRNAIIAAIPACAGAAARVFRPDANGRSGVPKPTQSNMSSATATKEIPAHSWTALVLESDPHRVLEGLAIAAYAIGAAEGYLYIRAEYPQAVRHTRAAIARPSSAASSVKIFSARILLRLEVREGAGAFVCGEETALIQSLEGKRGMPKLRPPTRWSEACAVIPPSSTTSRRWPACPG
jgi:hypothetical protein